MAYCCGRTSLHCYYAKMCRTGEYACDTCSTHLYIIAGKGCSFVYLRNCVFYVHAAYTSIVLDLGKSRLTPSRSPTETTWRMRSALKWRHTLQSKLQTCKSKSPYYLALGALKQNTLAGDRTRYLPLTRRLLIHETTLPHCDYLVHF